MDKVKVNVNKNISGGITDDTDTAILVELATRIEPSIILEIGTHQGRTAHTLAVVFPDASIYTVGVVKELNFKDTETNDQFQDDTLDLQETGKLCRNDKNVTQIIGSSQEKEIWAKLPQQIDLIFIDGCHKYNCVVFDTVQALFKRPRMIIWHDCIETMEFHKNNTVKALQNLERLIGIIFDVEDSRIAFWKNEACICSHGV